MRHTNDKLNSLHNYTFNFLKNHPELKEVLNSDLDFINFIESILTSNPSLLYIYNAQDQQGFKKFIYCSSAVNILGYSQEEISGLNGEILQNIIHPDDLDKVYDLQYKIKDIRPNETRSFEFRCVHKKADKVFWLNSSEKALQFDANGQVKYIIGVANNVTQTKKIQFDSQQSERKLNLALKNNNSAVWEWDLENDMAWYSKHFYNLLGYSYKNKSVQQDFLINLIHPNHIALFESNVSSFNDENSFFEMELQLKKISGEYEWFKMSASSSNKCGTVDFNSVIGVVSSIHEQKSNQLKLKCVNEDLKQYARIASHDLKEPLNTIKSFVGLFKDEFVNDISDEGKVYLDFIDEATIRMKKLIEGLLSQSLISSEQSNFENYNLNHLVDDAIKDLYAKVKATKATITVNELPTIYCNPILVKQLFFNLLSNSLKYIDESSIPNIEIGVVDAFNKHEIYVKDNGIGIQKANYEKVFGLFKRLHSSSEYEGSGIGLSNCKKIVEKHNGTIRCESNHDQGTTFFVVFNKF